MRKKSTSNWGNNSVKSELVIASLRKGDKKAFEAIYFEFYDMIYYLCIQYIQDKKISEDMVHDTFLKLWEVRGSLSDEDNIRNFLYTITKNNCLNYLRNQKIVLKYKNYIGYQEAVFNCESMVKLGDYLEFKELKERIEESISMLPEDIRDTFTLSRNKELKYKEIAVKQNISIKTVEARISRALRILREELKDFLPVLWSLLYFLNNLL